MKAFFKKTVLALVLLGGISMSLTSCGTVFGGRRTACQKTKPVAGAPRRQLRPVPFIFDIICPLPLISLGIDFATRSIYRPCRQQNQNNTPAQQDDGSGFHPQQ